MHYVTAIPSTASIPGQPTCRQVFLLKWQAGILVEMSPPFPSPPPLPVLPLLTSLTPERGMLIMFKELIASTLP